MFFKLFPVIWAITLISIPIVNSGLLRFFIKDNWSYFKDYWNLFALLGLIFIIVGINFAKRAKKVYKVKSLDETSSKLATTGVFRIIRHPIYSGWVIIFFGIALISDSITSLILCPILLIIVDIHALCEEKLILIPKYGKDYKKFMEKTPNRIIPTPLNFFLLIITILVIYVGFLNIS
ncbi:MAG: methyltransferase family protein [Promethearchaeota archaeon]